MKMSLIVIMFMMMIMIMAMIRVMRMIMITASQVKGAGATGGTFLRRVSGATLPAAGMVLHLASGGA